MTDQQKVRKAFEAWMSRNLIRHTHWDESEHSYMGMMTQRAWEAWQAALAHASSATTNPQESSSRLVDDHVAGGGKLEGEERCAPVSIDKAYIADLERTMAEIAELLSVEDRGQTMGDDIVRAIRMMTKDAVRYRSLRDAKDTKEFWIAHGEYGRMSRWNGDRADQAIDQAIAGRRGDGNG